MEHSLRFVWLEITGRCQLECTHCYADSGPKGTHGRMTDIDWHRVIEAAARLGVGTVQFIGGCVGRDRVPRRSCRFTPGQSFWCVSRYGEP